MPDEKELSEESFVVLLSQIQDGFYYYYNKYLETNV